MTHLQEFEKNEESPLLKLIGNRFIQAGIAGIPYAGGPIQVYIADVLREGRERKWREYWESIEHRIDILQRDRIDESYFETEDFLQRFQLLYEEVVNRADKEKIKYLHEYFLGIIRNSAPDITWKDLFFQYITRLSGAHLDVLHCFYTIQGHLSYTERFGIPKRVPHRSPLSIEDICVQNEKIEPDLGDSLIADLVAIGLIQIWMGEPKEPRSWSISNSGLRFMRFLFAEWNETGSSNIRKS